MNTMANYYDEIATWVNTLSEVLNSDIFDNTWSTEQGSARRIVFEYENNVKLTWAVTPDNQHVLQLWGPKAGSVDIDSLDFIYETTTSSYNFRGATKENILTVLDSLNKCTLKAVYFPWANFLEDEEIYEGARLLRNSIDEGALELRDFINEEFDEIDRYTTILTMCLLSIKEHILPKTWGKTTQQIVYGDDYLIENSPLYRFYEGIYQLESEEKIIIDWDECCASCSRGFIVPDGMPSVILWGQNSQYSYRSDSSVELELYADTNTYEILSKLVKKHALKDVTITYYGDD